MEEKSEFWLRADVEEGAQYSVCFEPGRGMNFTHLKKGEIEAIDQSTRDLFEARYAGLGALIGPHFHHRNSAVIAPVKNEALFPHIAIDKAKGSKEPFSHGIARYAPWKVEESSDTHLYASLKGDDEWRGVPLKELEGQNFEMSYHAHVTSKGLEIELSVIGETESIVGLHTYYALGSGASVIKAHVQDRYVDKSVWKKIPVEWGFDDEHHLAYVLDKDTDFGFHPFPDPLKGRIVLQTASHELEVCYSSPNEENSFQIWHPKNSSFVCIEPLSAQDPRKPKLTVNRLKIEIAIH